MKLMTVRQFRDKATKALKSKEPLLILRRSEIAGIFFPLPSQAFPFEIKKDLFLTLTESIKKRLKLKGVREEDILEDFEKFRKARRGR